MRSLHRTVYAIAALSLFSSAFVVGISPHDSRARAMSPQDGDANADGDMGDLGGATLPPDVQQRLARVSPSQDFRPAVTFWEVLGKVKSRYVDKITDQDKLSRGAVASMLRFLHDPFSRVVSPEELKLDQQEAEGQFTGAGVVLGARLSGKQDPIGNEPAHPAGPPRRMPDEPVRVWQLVVVDVAPNSPAEVAGLQTGDIVSKINGTRIDRNPLAKDTIDDLNLLLNGPDVKTVSLSVLRPSTNETLDFPMKANGPMQIPAVEGRMLPQGSGYLRVRLFTPDAGTAVSRELAKLTGTSLMLDLRGNAGGSLPAALHVLGSLGVDNAASLVESRGASKRLAADTSGPRSPFTHLVVLVDGGTSGVAEMVAGSLHENKGAILAGAPTFGNGLVQTLYPLKDGWSYSLTTGCLQTSKGLQFNQHGLAVERTLDPKQLKGEGAIAAALPFLVALK